MACNLLAILVSIAPVKKLFSNTGLVIRKHQNQRNNKTIEDLGCFIGTMYFNISSENGDKKKLKTN